MPPELVKKIIYGVRDPTTLLACYDTTGYVRDILEPIDWNEILWCEVYPPQYANFSFWQDLDFGDRKYVRIILLDKCSHCPRRDTLKFLNFKLRLCPECLVRYTIPTRIVNTPFDVKQFHGMFEREHGRLPKLDRGSHTSGNNTQKNSYYLAQDYIEQVEQFLIHPRTTATRKFRLKFSLFKYSTLPKEDDRTRAASIRRITAANTEEQITIEARQDAWNQRHARILAQIVEFKFTVKPENAE